MRHIAPLSKGVGMFAFIASEIRRIGNTCTWSWEGWCAAWASEKSLRQWSVVNVLSAALAFYLPLSTAERALVLGFGLLVLVAELLNTAIEEVVDYISTEHNPHAKKAKDVGSAVVAVTAIAGGVVWLVILIG